MPYIKQEDRKKFQNALNSIEEISNKGELEYLIYSLMMKYMKGKEFRYSILHDCAYAAQHCCDEFRRRTLDKREDLAILDNGDIFSVNTEYKVDEANNCEDLIISEELNVVGTQAIFTDESIGMENESTFYVEGLGFEKIAKEPRENRIKRFTQQGIDWKKKETPYNDFLSK